MPEVVETPSNGAPNGAPKNGTQVEAKPAPKTTWDIAKEPLKYRVHGKERELKDWDTVKQRLSYADAFELKAQQEAEARQKAEAEAAEWKSIRESEDPEKIWQMMEKGLGQKAYKAAEARFRKLIAEEEASKQLSPEAKRYKEEAERVAQEKARLEADLKSREEKAQQQEFDRQTREVAQYLDGVIGEALADSGLKSESAAYFMPHVAALINRSQELGLEVEPKAIAQEVFRVQAEMTHNLLSKLDPNSVLDMLESIPVKVEGRPDSTLRKEMMRAWVDRKNKRSVDGGTPQQEEEVAPKVQRKPQPKYVGDVLRGFMKR